MVDLPERHIPPEERDAAVAHLRKMADEREASDPEWADIVEAIAYWRMRESNARAIFIRAAEELLAAGDDHPTIAEAASLYQDADAFVIDELIQRTVDELALDGALAEGIDVITARVLSRALASGQLTERMLTGWAATVYGRTSHSKVVSELADIDGAYDAIDGTANSKRRDLLDEHVRQIAEVMLESGEGVAPPP